MGGCHLIGAGPPFGRHRRHAHPPTRTNPGAQPCHTRQLQQSSTHQCVPSRGKERRRMSPTKSLSRVEDPRCAFANPADCFAKRYGAFVLPLRSDIDESGYDCSATGLDLMSLSRSSPHWARLYTPDNPPFGVLIVRIVDGAPRAPAETDSARHGPMPRGQRERTATTDGHSGRPASAECLSLHDLVR